MDLKEPKDKWWSVTKFDVGRELGNPDWVNWAVKRIKELESRLAGEGEKKIDDSCCATGCNKPFYAYVCKEHFHLGAD